ncbi:MAG TPA: ABC transporter ATP-binding protein [Candidatus Thermoplasmatota archaeon]|nr:ABC transporter ATP-binding protein [Candidatus Thermoplasmatota archaeon]
MGVLTCTNLSRFHGDVVGVNDLTLDIQPGITGLLGPNGAGKTTLFRMAMGLIRPSAGSILVLDENPWDNPPLLRRIGYVPDGDAPWQDYTGLEAATHFANLSGITGASAQSAAGEALSKVGLSGAADKKVGAYSRGMRQRLKFAFATIGEPELWLLDEPLLATDPLTRRDLIGLIREHAAKGGSVVISTHVLTDVEALTQRIALMAHGRLLAHGEVHEIRDMLERYPRTVRVGTPNPREMGSLLWNLPSVLSLEATEGAVIVKTRQPQQFFAQLQDLLGAKDIEFTSVTSLDEDVESIFRYLVSEP